MPETMRGAPEPMCGDASRDAASLLAHLRANADPANVEGMRRFGIRGGEVLGIRVTDLRRVAARALRARKSDDAWRHAVAAGLWASGVHEARILATIVDAPSLVTREQAESWALELDSWDVCDQLCLNLLDRTPLAYEIAEAWAGREEEFVKRAGFALMAGLAWHDRDSPDERLLPFLALIEREAHDERGFVRKSVNWALRQIGKRSAGLNAEAVGCAERILGAEPSRAARWVASGALRELRSEAVAGRLGI